MLRALLLLIPLLAPAAVVVRPFANMYSGPSEDKDVVSQAIFSTNVDIVEEKPGWARIRTPDDYAGWTRIDALLKADGAYARSGRVAEVSSLFAHLYREPSVTKRAPLITVPFESRLEIVAEPEQEKQRWIQVRLPDDRPAWVQRGDVAIDSQKLAVRAMVELARRFLGLPYTWGGTSSFGYDCSGFTQMLCRRRGINLPRDAQPQADWTGMQPVSSPAELQPGDLLYFGNSDKKITHTGLYIGTGEFIHATTSGKPVVQISRLSDELWTKALVAMRRPK
jgi:gamma-D-glutamyl-L-lysine dipeptidyl-peptidase